MQEKRIFTFDTTLRDGEQSPGACMTPEEKLCMARQLEILGVDIIEAGFPLASAGEFKAVRQIAREVRGSQIAAIAKASITDIDRTWEALREAADPRIHIILPSSDIQLQYQLMKSRQQALEIARKTVTHARTCTENVEFSAMDATRTDKDFLCRLLEAAIDAGARVINIADTVGYAVPGEFGALIDSLFKNVRGIGDVVLSVHCHDDLGLAVANTLAAIEHGAQQVKCTVNGIGERAGNAALEEVVMALRMRKDYWGAVTGIRTEHIYATSQLLTEMTGIAVQPNKAIVGANAFAHGAGIHQDGLMKKRDTYEMISPESVGAPEIPFILGKHAGRQAVREYLEAIGHVLDREELDHVFHSFKDRADTVKHMLNEDLEAILYRELYGRKETYTLIDLRTVSGSSIRPAVTVKMKVHGKIVEAVGFKKGPVDAAFSAIKKITRTDYLLVECTARVIPAGDETSGEATVRLQHNGRTTAGRGVHADVIVASAMAYIQALNTIAWIREDENEKITTVGDISA